MVSIDIKRNEVGKEVLVFKNKDVRIAIIKILRDYRKSFNLNQFDTALEMVSQFYELINVYTAFIREVGLIKPFVVYYRGHASEFEFLINNFIKFKKGMLKYLTTPIF